MGKMYSYMIWIFTPNTLKTRFKDWTCKGMTAICKVTTGVIKFSFDTREDKYLLEKQDFYQYLHMWHYVHIVKNVTETSMGARRWVLSVGLLDD